MNWLCLLLVGLSAVTGTTSVRLDAGEARPTAASSRVFLLPPKGERVTDPRPTLRIQGAPSGSRWIFQVCQRADFTGPTLFSRYHLLPITHGDADSRRQNDYLESTEWTVPFSLGIEWRQDWTKDALPDLLREIGRGTRNRQEYLQAVTRYLAYGLGFTPRVESHQYEAWEVVNRGRGLCGNLSEVLLYAARLLGLPYRYVALQSVSPNGRILGDTAAEVFVDGRWQFFGALHDWSQPGWNASSIEESAPHLELYRLAEGSYYFDEYFHGTRNYTVELNSLARANFAMAPESFKPDLLYGEGQARHCRGIEGLRSDVRPGLFRIPDPAMSADQWADSGNGGASQVAPSGEFYFGANGANSTAERTVVTGPFRLAEAQGLHFSIFVKSLYPGAYVRLRTIIAMQQKLPDRRISLPHVAAASGKPDETPWIRRDIPLDSLRRDLLDRGLGSCRLQISLGVENRDKLGVVAAAYMKYPQFGTDRYPIGLFGWVPAVLHPGLGLPGVSRRIYWRVRTQADGASWVTSWFDLELPATPQAPPQDTSGKSTR